MRWIKTVIQRCTCKDVGMTPLSCCICCHRDTTIIAVRFLEPKLKRMSTILSSSRWRTRLVSRLPASNWEREEKYEHVNILWERWRIDASKVVNREWTPGNVLWLLWSLTHRFSAGPVLDSEAWRNTPIGGEQGVSCLHQTQLSDVPVQPAVLQGQRVVRPPGPTGAVHCCWHVFLHPGGIPMFGL